MFSRTPWKSASCSQLLCCFMIIPCAFTETYTLQYNISWKRTIPHQKIWLSNFITIDSEMELVDCCVSGLNKHPPIRHRKSIHSAKNFHTVRVLVYHQNNYSIWLSTLHMCIMVDVLRNEGSTEKRNTTKHTESGPPSPLILSCLASSLDHHSRALFPMKKACLIILVSKVCDFRSFAATFTVRLIPRSMV